MMCPVSVSSSFCSDVYFGNKCHYYYVYISLYSGEGGKEKKRSMSGGKLKNLRSDNTTGIWRSWRCRGRWRRKVGKLSGLFSQSQSRTCPCNLLVQLLHVCWFVQPQALFLILLHGAETLQVDIYKNVSKKCFIFCW